MAVRIGDSTDEYLEAPDDPGDDETGNLVNGKGGDDTVVGGTASDILIGGTGDDIIDAVANTSGSGDTGIGGDGNDDLYEAGPKRVE